MNRILQKLLNYPLVMRAVSLGDQILFAGGNFLLTVLLTRFYNAGDLAAYGMAISVALILQSIQRNTYVIHNAVLDVKLFRRRRHKILAQQMIAVIPVFLLLAVLSGTLVLFYPYSLFTKTIVASAACFAIYAQLEFERMVLVKCKKFIVPFLTSLAYIALNIGFLICHENLSFYDVMAALCVFALVKSLVMLPVIGRPDFKGGWRLFRSDFRHNAQDSVYGVIGYSGYNHAPVFLLGIFAAPVEAAAFVAMRGLMQPLQVIIRSMDVIDKNFFRSRLSGGKNMKAVMNAQIALYAGLSVVLTGLICIFGVQIVHLLYAGKYMDYKTTLWAWAVINIFFSVLQPVESAIVARKRLNAYNRSRLMIGLVTCAVLVPIVPLFEAHGAVIVTMLASIIAFTTAYKVAAKEGR